MRRCRPDRRRPAAGPRCAAPAARGAPIAESPARGAGPRCATPIALGAPIAESAARGASDIADAALDGRLVSVASARAVMATESVQSARAAADRRGAIGSVAAAIGAQLELLGQDQLPGAALLLNACSRPGDHANLFPMTAPFSDLLWTFNAGVLCAAPPEVRLAARHLLRCAPRAARCELARICACAVPGRDPVSLGRLPVRAASREEAHALVASLSWSAVAELVIEAPPVGAGAGAEPSFFWDAFEERLCDFDVLNRWRDFVEAGAQDPELPPGPARAAFARRACELDVSSCLDDYAEEHRQGPWSVRVRRKPAEQTPEQALQALLQDAQSSGTPRIRHS